MLSCIFYHLLYKDENFQNIFRISLSWSTCKSFDKEIRSSLNVSIQQYSNENWIARIVYYHINCKHYDNYLVEIWQGLRGGNCTFFHWAIIPLILTYNHFLCMQTIFSFNLFINLFFIFGSVSKRDIQLNLSKKLNF